MTRQLARTSVPEVLGRVRDLVRPPMQSAVDRLADPQLRRIAAYQLGWCDVAGRPTDSGGKAIRPALAVLSAQTVGGSPEAGIPGAIAIELVHNFSLLHDDVMDRDVERRHRPTGWVAFGEGQAILAGNAMMTLAIEVLIESEPGRRSLPGLLDAVQLLIAGQSRDLLLEQATTVQLPEVLEMEAGKTAALLSCASSIGAVAAGASDEIVAGMAAFGHELGLAFQLVDDILGVVGDPARTGKSSSSDVRAGKRSAPIAAALAAPSPAAAQLRDLLAAGPPTTEPDVALATQLIIDAGGIEWASDEANARLATALRHVDQLPLNAAAVAELSSLATYIVSRDQ